MTALDHLAPTLRLLGLALPKDAHDPVELARVLAAHDPDTLHRFTAWGLDCAERVVRSDADAAAAAAAAHAAAHAHAAATAAHAAAAAAPSVERIWQLDRLAYCLIARDD